MTQEDKQLLLKDICARLPYGVKAHGPNETDDTIWTLDYDSNINVLVYVGWRPYLRPMSSMTEEEEDEYDSMFSNARRIYCNCAYYDTVQEDDIPDFIDWLNAHHFDYRGLIEKGLVLKAPEGMYKNE